MVVWYEALRNWMKKHGISIKEFTRRTGIPRTTIQDWLAGKVPVPSEKWLEKLREVTGIFITGAPVQVREQIEPKRQQIHLRSIKLLASLLKMVASYLIGFIEKSTAQERNSLRHELGQGLEDLLDGTRGLYSEKSREQVLKDRTNVRKRKNQICNPREES